MTNQVTAGIATVLLIGGVACARPQATSRAAIDSLAARGDTVALARAAERTCKGSNSQQSCYEDFFVQLARSDRVHLALGALTALAANHLDIQRDGHGYTHVIGIRAWHPGADVASIFRSCTGLFQSGCYHGVIQAYLTEGGTVDSSRAVALCNQVAAAPSDRWMRFQCVHGLGHGFEMAWNWDLPHALKGCDWLGDTWDKTSCYGGAFMENAVASMPGGHHTAVHALAASAASSDSSMSDHDMAGMEHDHAPDPKQITFKMRDSTNALYPCTIVDSVYQYSCYLVQGGLILTATYSDFARAAAACDQATPRNRVPCYISLGTNASGFTVQNTPKDRGGLLARRSGVPIHCFIGAVKNYIDVTAKADDGIAFCRAVPAGTDRNQCFGAVGEQIEVLYPTNADARTEACAKAGADGERECRLGAGLKPAQ